MNYSSRLREIVCLLCLLISWHAGAQGYPNRTIKIVTLVTPSSSDTIARAIASRLSEKLGQPVIVDNRPGAGGTVAVMAAVRLAPDGYNFLITPNVITIAPWTSKDLGYDPRKDLVPVGRLAYAPMALVINPDVPAKSFVEFVALIHAQPGKWNYGSPGIGSPQHMSMEYLKQQLSLDMVHIPYPQSPPAVMDVVAGRTAAGVFTMSQVMAMAQTGKLRAIAVIGEKRFKLMPDIPSTQELGVNALEGPWFAMFAPAGTPTTIVERINSEVNTILAQPDIQQLLFAQGISVSTSTPSELGAQVKIDLERWGKVVAGAGMKPE